MAEFDLADDFTGPLKVGYVSLDFCLHIIDIVRWQKHNMTVGILRVKCDMIEMFEEHCRQELLWVFKYIASKCFQNWGRPNAMVLVFESFVYCTGKRVVKCGYLTRVNFIEHWSVVVQFEFNKKLAVVWSTMDEILLCSQCCYLGPFLFWQGFKFSIKSCFMELFYGCKYFPNAAYIVNIYCFEHDLNIN